MDNDVVVTPSRGFPFQVHEAALLTLGIATIVALLVKGQVFGPVILEAVGATLLYAWVLLSCRGRTDKLRIRFLASYVFVVWFYWAVGRFTPALGTKLRDETLLGIDEAIFGQTPAVFCQGAARAWLTDLLSICYMTYHLYLVVVVAHVALAPDFASQRLGPLLFTGFALGFAGYLLVPAVGPSLSYPELFQEPLPGGTTTRLIAEVVTTGSSRYDVFPSLHFLITCILLNYDWYRFRRRFWIMLVPSAGLLVSTVYLRYHYGVDAIAGLILFLALRQTFSQIERTRTKLPE